MSEPDCATEEVRTATMGDIVRTGGDSARTKIDVAAPVGILSLELRNGAETIETARPYADADLGRRIRVMWSGAEYRGRGRNTLWQGRAQLTGARIERFETINRLNPEMLLDQRGSSSVIWKSVTTGNRMGFDIWLGDAADDARQEQVREAAQEGRARGRLLREEPPQRRAEARGSGRAARARRARGPREGAHDDPVKSVEEGCS